MTFLIFSAEDVACIVWELICNSTVENFFPHTTVISFVFILSKTKVHNTYRSLKYDFFSNKGSLLMYCEGRNAANMVQTFQKNLPEVKN